MPYVFAAARMWRAEIDVLHVCSGDSRECKQRMEAYGNSLRLIDETQPGLPIRFHAVPGDPSSTVLDFARQNKEGLIVLDLGRHRSLYDGPPLSHAYQIVAQARCPVLSVRSGPAHSVQQ